MKLTARKITNEGMNDRIFDALLKDGVLLEAISNPPVAGLGARFRSSKFVSILRFEPRGRLDIEQKSVFEMASKYYGEIEAVK